MSLALPKPVRVEKAQKRIVRTRRPRRKRKGRTAAMRAECDRLWSLIVRARPDCESPREHACRRTFQGCHGLPKRAYPSTRWLPINGFNMCHSEHVYFTHRPLEWTEHLVSVWGQPVYDELRRLALRGEKPDVPATLEKLRAEAVALGIE